MSNLKASRQSNIFAGKDKGSEPQKAESQGRSNWSARGALDYQRRLVEFAYQRKYSPDLPEPAPVGEVVLLVGESVFRLQSSREYAETNYYSLRYVQLLCSSGELPAIKIGRDWFVISSP